MTKPFPNGAESFFLVLWPQKEGYQYDSYGITRPRNLSPRSVPRIPKLSIHHLALKYFSIMLMPKWNLTRDLLGCTLATSLNVLLEYTLVFYGQNGIAYALSPTSLEVNQGQSYRLGNLLTRKQAKNLKIL